MSEDLVTGKASVEEAQGFQPIPEAAPQHDEPKVYGSGDDELRRAAKDLGGDAPSTEAPIVERKLEWFSGEKAGEAIEGHAIDVGRAARELSRVHQAEAAAQFEGAANELAGVVDEIRNGPQSPEAQPESPPPPPADGIDPEIKQALENPKIRQALEAEFNRVAQAQQAFGHAAMQAAQISLASVFSSYPELSGLNGQQLQGALLAMQQTDPAKAAKIQADLNRTAALYQQSQQAQQAQAQHAQAAMQQWAQRESQSFEEWAAHNESPETLKKAKEQIVDIAKDVYGLSKNDLAAVYRANPVLQSAVFQRVMLDAAKYHMARMNATANPVRNVPPVHKPGTSDPAAHHYADAMQARNMFNKDPNVKNAVALVRAQRAARG